MLRRVTPREGLDEQRQTPLFPIFKNFLQLCPIHNDIRIVKASEKNFLLSCSKFSVFSIRFHYKYMQFSRKDTISAYVEKINGGKCSPLEEKLIEFMAETSAEEWEALARILKRFVIKFNLTICRTMHNNEIIK